MTASAESGATPDTSSGRVPDFFIVGQPKSGTTALFEILRAHPQIYMPELKEPVFLASDLLAGVQRASVRARPQTLEGYLSLFAAAGPQQRAGEASSLYLWSRSAASNIAQLQPAARIIAILREPTSFLRSLHLQLLQDHNETEREFGAALALEGERREGRRIPRGCARPAALIYSDYVHYVAQLRRYYAVFPPDQILVLIYDDFRADNEGTVRTVLRFLEVDDAHPIEVALANRTVRLRSKPLDDVIRTVSTGRGGVLRVLKAPVKALTSRRLRHGALRVARRSVVYGEPRPADASLMLELRKRFREEVGELSEFLGRDLVSLWGYDGID
jgi:Sulfotransferase domain